MTEEERAHLQMQRRGNSRSSFPSDLDLELDALLEIAYPSSESEREKVDLAMDAMADRVNVLALNDPKRESLDYAEKLVRETILTFKAVQESGRLSPRNNSIPANYGRRTQKPPVRNKV
jgi:hypothetical protein